MSVDVKKVLPMPTCPKCSSEKTVKNGAAPEAQIVVFDDWEASLPLHNGKQRFKCNASDRQFVKNPQKIMISQAKRELIDRLLLERISLAGIARAVEVSQRWLQTYVNDKYALVPRTIQVTPKKKES